MLECLLVTGCGFKILNPKSQIPNTKYETNYNI